MNLLPLGTQAPDFTLSDQNGTAHSLSQYQGKYVLLYFYPKDDTPGCTKEACGIRDTHSSFKELNAVVLGVSADSPKRHTKFIAKHKLPFTLLSDENKNMLRAYGAWGLKKFMGREYEGIFRISYLIDPEGNIVKAYPKVKPTEHASEVLEDLRKMQ